MASLQTGERIVKHSSRRLGRGGRDLVCVRVVGEHSFGWVEAAKLWGAKLEAIVQGISLPKSIREVFDLPLECTLDLAVKMTPSDCPWDGLLFGTILDVVDAEQVGSCFRAWRPRTGVVALHGHLSRSACDKLGWNWVSAIGYKHQVCKMAHSRLGGMTDST